MSPLFCFMICWLCSFAYVLTNEYSNNNCGKTENSNTGKFVYGGSKSKKVPEGIHCSWTILSREFLYLDFESFFLSNEDNFTIFNDLQEIVFGPFSGQYENVVIVSGLKNLTAVLKTSETKYNWERSFSVAYSPSCDIKKSNLISGVLNSPLYNPRTLKAPLECNFEFSGQGTSQKPVVLSFSFTQLSLNNGSIRLESKGEFNDTYNGSSFPRKFLTKNLLKLQLTLNLTEENQNFTIFYELVSEVCSKTLDLNTSHPTGRISFQLKKNSHSGQPWMICSWIVRSPNGTKIRTNFKNLELSGTLDRFILSTPNEKDFPALQFNSKSNQDLQAEEHISPSNEFWAHLDALQSHSEIKIEMDFSIYEDRKTIENSGDILISLNDSLIHKLQVPPSQLVRINFNDLLRGNATSLELYSDFSGEDSPFLILTSSYPLRWVISPTNRLKIIVKQFNEPKKIKISFSGAQKGCDAIAVKSKGQFTLTGKCQKICQWILPPSFDSSGTYLIHYDASIPHVAAKASLRLLDSKLTLLINEYDDLLPEVTVPSKVGALLQISRSCGSSGNINAFAASYSLENSCNVAMTMSTGETIFISSPRYPNRYSVNSRCHWMLFTEIETIALHFTFSHFKLSEGHTLTFKTERFEPVTLSSDNQLLLPDDEIFPGFLVDIQFQAHQIYPANNNPRFAFQVTAYDCGGLENKNSGVIKTSAKKGKRCIWKINVPCASQICNILLKIVFDSGQDIEIFDGPSLRSPRLEYSDLNEIFVKSSSVMILYKPLDDTSQDLRIEYRSYECTEESSCEDGFCRKPVWKCNKDDQCGYYDGVCESSSSSSSFTTKSTEKNDSPCPVLTTVNHDEKTTKKAIVLPLTTSLSTTSTITDTESINDTTNQQEQKNRVPEQKENYVPVTFLWIGSVGGLAVGIFCCGFVFWLIQRRNKNGNDRRWGAVSAVNPTFDKNNDSISF